MSFQTSGLILSWIAILLLALVVSGLVRQVHALSGSGTLSQGSLGPRPGSRAPALDRLAPDRATPMVLLFLSRDCRTCAEVLEEAGSAGRDGVMLRALYGGEAPAGAVDSGVSVHADQAELFERYDAIVTPFAVVVDRAGRVVRSEPIGSRAAFRGLLDAVGGLPGGGGTSAGGNTEQVGGRP
jgi:hypothetical protein